jgi:hypothetical protein
MRILTAIAVMVCTFASPNLVLAEDIVARMVGVWVGQGTVRPRGFDAPEKIRCKVVGEKLSEVEVKFAGRCATASGTGAFRLFVAQDIGGSRFAARIRLSNAKDALDFKGSLGGDTIVLKQNEVVEQKDRKVLATITLKIPEGMDIEMTNDIVDQNSGETAQSLAIQFTRQK